MLKQINGTLDASGACVRIGEAVFPAPFAPGLEYAPPARGTWNIVHTGMLIPQAHQIFVCAQSCLRGVVLTAAEMGAQSRFSTIAIREHNVTDGDMERLIIDGVADILGRLPEQPKAVLLYTSCIHHFMGCDLPLVYRTLRARHPGIAFTDCYMNPIMRKSGLTPDQLMRRQLYSLLEPREKEPRAINIIGNDFATDATSELVQLIAQSGWHLREITGCRTYADYQEMAAAQANITYIPAAQAGAQALKHRLGQTALSLPFSYDYDEITTALYRLADYLGVAHPDYSAAAAACEQALADARAVIGDTPVALDYTFSSRPLGLARLLLSHGFRVTRVYADGFTGEERADFDWLKTHYPELELYATTQVKMRVLPRSTECKLLALGQKAAYFTGSSYFVNIVEGGGMYGFDGILRLTRQMTEAFAQPKNVRALIQIKGMGCGTCL